MRFVTSDVIATGRKHRYRFATGEKLILFKHILLSCILVNNRVIVIQDKQKIFELQLQLQQNRVINLQFYKLQLRGSFNKQGKFFSIRTNNSDGSLIFFSLITWMKFLLQIKTKSLRVLVINKKVKKNSMLQD